MRVPAFYFTACYMPGGGGHGAATAFFAASARCFYLYFCCNLPTCFSGVIWAKRCVWQRPSLPLSAPGNLSNCLCAAAGFQAIADKKRQKWAGTKIRCLPCFMLPLAKGSYSSPKMAMPTSTAAMTAYCPLDSFSFKNSRDHSTEKMLYDAMVGAATMALPDSANT